MAAIELPRRAREQADIKDLHDCWEIRDLALTGAPAHAAIFRRMVIQRSVAR